MSLFWRIWTVALVQMVVVMTGLFALRSLPIGVWPSARSELLSQWLGQVADDEASLRAALEWGATEWAAGIRVTRADGVELVRGEAPAPLRDDERAQLVATGRFARGAELFSVTRSGTLVAVRAPLAWPGRQAFFLVGLSVLGLFVMAVVLSRTVARPIDSMAKAVAQLAAGDYAARTGIERKDELGEMAQRIDRLAAHLARARTTERELLANVSHELRTPLARVRVALEIGETAPSEAQSVLAEVGEDLAELERLIDDVFMLARLGGPVELPLRLEPCQLNELVQACTSRFRERWPAVSLEVTNAEVATLADAGLVRRTIDNLLENAARHGASPIRLECAVADGAWVLRVSDSGPGIPESELERLFTPFFRGERARSASPGGLGLGLSLTRRIAQAHGGSVTVENQRPGLCVTVRLPLAREHG
ncbi:MAG: HAMP domain-containing histidine kinase [Archangiaceae bacterium]|nr:HAMP domain-containing histidine kinase [Archangiaceae bacterium]